MIAEELALGVWSQARGQVVKRLDPLPGAGRGEHGRAIAAEDDPVSPKTVMRCYVVEA